MISLVSGQTSTLYIWLCDSLILQSGKTPGVMLIVWMLSCNFGSFFRLLCDWLESVQWCWGSIWCSFFLLKLDTPLAIARQLCGCLLQYLYQVDPPQTFRTSFHSSRHLTRCGDVSKKVRVQAWFTNVPTITQEEKKNKKKKKREIFSLTYSILFNKVINQWCILKVHIIN